MKKLITIMAAAASALLAFGALGDVSAPPAGFESYNSGDGFVPSVSEGGSTYWYAAAVDDTNIITNYAESGTSVPTLPTNVVRPDGMKENDAYPSNSNFLSLETSTPLFRSVQANSQDGTFTGSTIGDGIYLDTLVKFTASEEEFKDGALEANVDKIAIEYVDQTNDETIENPIKAFVIRAGYIGSDSLFQTNYYAYLTDDKTFQNFDVNAWHRLTVRTIANIGGNNVGFIVYLDQKPLAYDEDCGDNFSPSTDAQNYYNDEIHAVYPSAVDANITGGDQIAAVAFSGNGSIDDVVFTTETPEFITASESVIVPFVADAGVTAISVLPDGATDAILVDMTADTLSAQLPAQTAAFTVTATIDTANGYEFVSMTVGESVYDTNPASVTGYTGDAITITTVRNNFNLFDENGDAIEGTFQTLSGALAVEGVAKIVLAHHYEVTEEETGSEQEIYTIDGNIVLDLNGKTLDGGEGNGFELFYVTGSLKVIDSVGGGKIVYGGDVFGSDGSLLIGDVSGDNGVTIDGVLFNDQVPGYIIRANVLAEDNTDAEDAFLWNTYLGDGEDIESEANLVGDYWVVTPKDGGEPTEIAVPTAETGLVYDGTEKIGVAAGEGYTLSGDFKATNAGEYTAIATPASGYAWVGGSTDATNIVWSIAAKTDADVVVTLTSEIAEYTTQLEFPTASATIGGDDVAGTPAWDPSTITEPEAGATNTYTVTFTVTTANYAGSTGTATFKVYKEASSGGWEPDPSKIDPSATAAETYSELAGTALATANAQKLTEWAAAESIDFATVTGDADAYVDAFLLNCAPAEVEAAKADFKATITVNADGTVTVTAPGDYNVTPTIQGKESLSDSEWHAKTDGDQFFRAVLSL